MVFKIGEKVKKKKGYIFIGIVVSQYNVNDGDIRYDVQIDGKESIAELHRLMKNKDISIKSAKTMMWLEEQLMNCHGMIHIFAHEQLALVK